MDPGALKNSPRLGLRQRCFRCRGARGPKLTGASSACRCANTAVEAPKAQAPSADIAKQAAALPTAFVEQNYAGEQPIARRFLPVRRASRESRLNKWLQNRHLGDKMHE